MGRSLVWDVLFEVTVETVYPHGTIQKARRNLGVCDRPEAWGVGWCVLRRLRPHSGGQVLRLSASREAVAIQWRRTWKWPNLK